MGITLLSQLGHIRDLGCRAQVCTSITCGLESLEHKTWLPGFTPKVGDKDKDKKMW